MIFVKLSRILFKVLYFEFIISSSPNIIRMIKSRRMRWAGHVARMGETRNAFRILVGKPEGKRPLGGKLLPQYIFTGCWLGLYFNLKD
jgi:hypothetical protein